MHKVDSPDDENYSTSEIIIPRKQKIEPKLQLINGIKLIIESIFILVTEILNSCLDLLKIPKSKDIKGQLALVTGGGNGLGREISIELAKFGCNVAIADIDFKNAVKIEQLIVKEYNVKAKAYQVDISNYDEVNNLKISIEKDLGSVDILINNAGLMPTKSTLHESSRDEIEKTIAVNLTSHFWTLQTFLSSMRRRRRGHIVAISSIAALVGVPLALTYGSTKFAIRGLMESLRIELLITRHDFIKLTTVYPYFIKTNKDLIEFLEANEILKYYPALEPSYVAKEIVNAILKNKTSLIIPGWYAPITRLLNMIPNRTITALSNRFFKVRRIKKKI